MFKFVVTKNITELFHRAVLQNDLVRVKLLLEQAKNEAKFNIDEINEDGLTALQFGCFASNLELVRVLVEHGANVKVQDRDGWTLSHAAALGGNVDIVRYLAKLGNQVGCRNDNGQLPIDLATDIPTVIILLKYMLENGHHGEVQAYLHSHPHLKYEISREINIAIKMENDERIVQESLPYTSHRSRRLSSAQNNTLNNNRDSYKNPKRKVKGAFSLLSSPVVVQARANHSEEADDVFTQETTSSLDRKRLKGERDVSRSSSKIHGSCASSLADSASDSSVSSNASNGKVVTARYIQRSASARSDEYYNYHSHLSRNRLSQRDEEVRRSICLGNIGKDLPISLTERSTFYSDDEAAHRRQADALRRHGQQQQREPVRRTPSIQYPEVYI